MILINRIPLLGIRVRLTLTVVDENPSVVSVNSKVFLARIILMPTVVYAAIVFDELLLALAGRFMVKLRVLARADEKMEVLLSSVYDVRMSRKKLDEQTK